MDAYQMPKTTEAEKAARTRSVQEALKGASQVPLQIADRCAELIALARVVVEKGNKNAVCDAGVGALMADAGLRGAAFNVSVNLKSIKDETYLREASSRVDKLQALADESRHEILNMVHARM